MSREPISAWFYVVVVVRLGRRFLLVQERKFGQSWYLPAGRVEKGETLAAAAFRETVEEAGIGVTLEAILGVDFEVRAEGGVKERVIFLARPVDDAPVKTVADEESLGASWFTLDEVRGLPLRGQDVIRYLERVEAGGPFLPIRYLE
jgi:phosphatase NudJ